MKGDAAQGGSKDREEEVEYGDKTIKFPHLLTQLTHSNPTNETMFICKAARTFPIVFARSVHSWILLEDLVDCY